MLCPLPSNKNWQRLLKLKNNNKGHALILWNAYKENIPDYIFEKLEKEYAQQFSDKKEEIVPVIQQPTRKAVTKFSKFIEFAEISPNVEPIVNTSKPVTESIQSSIVKKIEEPFDFKKREQEVSDIIINNEGKYVNIQLKPGSLIFEGLVTGNKNNTKLELEIRTNKGSLLFITPNQILNKESIIITQPIVTTQSTVVPQNSNTNKLVEEEKKQVFAFVKNNQDQYININVYNGSGTYQKKVTGNIKDLFFEVTNANNKSEYIRLSRVANLKFKPATANINKTPSPVVEPVQQSVDTKIKPNIEITQSNYTKDTAPNNPTIGFIFTENAEMLDTTKNVYMTQAIIRTTKEGLKNINALPIITKKLQVAGGQWSNTDEDFNEFKRLNTMLIKRHLSDNWSKIVFPQGFATDKAKLPTRFAEWLRKELLDNFGLVTELNDTKTGLISKSIQNVNIDDNNISSENNIKGDFVDNFIKDNLNKYVKIKFKTSDKIFESRITGKSLGFKIETITNTGKVVYIKLEDIQNNDNVLKYDKRFTRSLVSEELEPFVKRLEESTNYNYEKIQEDLLNNENIIFYPVLTNEDNQQVGLYYTKDVVPSFPRFEKTLEGAIQAVINDAINSNITFKIINNNSKILGNLAPLIKGFYNSLTSEQQEKIKNIQEIHDSLITPMSDLNFIEMLKCKI